MPRLEYFLVADSVSVDQFTNTVSVFHVIEQIRAPKFPVHIPRFACVSSLNIEEEDFGKDFQLTVNIKNPSGKYGEPNRINFTAEKRRQRFIAHLVNFKIEGRGQLLFELLLNKERLASHTVDIIKDEPDSDNSPDG